MSAMFEHCDHFVTTSHTSVEVLSSHFHELDARIQIIPHGLNFRSFQTPRRRKWGSEKLRILIAGDITASKVLHTILRPLELDGNRLLEVDVAGTCPEELQALSKYHGSYAREELAKS
jgi:hypothetical protein